MAHFRPRTCAHSRAKSNYTTGTVRPTYSLPPKARAGWETTHLESARLARLPVLDGDLAFALEFALKIPVVLVLPVDRSPEIRNWSEGERRGDWR